MTTHKPKRKRTVEERAFDAAFDFWHPPGTYIMTRDLDASRKEREAFALGYVKGHRAAKRERKQP